SPGQPAWAFFVLRILVLPSAALSAASPRSFLAAGFTLQSLTDQPETVVLSSYKSRRSLHH
ncbi:MAG TPA: hypothetical protein VGB43_00800, partial [Flavobacterium sp.]